jgi:hypothetical protein
MSVVAPIAADPGVLILIGSYKIGKERVFMQVREDRERAGARERSAATTRSSRILRRVTGGTCWSQGASPCLLLQLAEALNERVWVTPAKFKTLALLGWPAATMGRLTTDPAEVR